MSFEGFGVEGVSGAGFLPNSALYAFVSVFLCMCKMYLLEILLDVCLSRYSSDDPIPPPKTAMGWMTLSNILSQILPGIWKFQHLTACKALQAFPLVETP